MLDLSNCKRISAKGFSFLLLATSCNAKTTKCQPPKTIQISNSENGLEKPNPPGAKRPNNGDVFLTEFSWKKCFCADNNNLFEQHPVVGTTCAHFILFCEFGFSRSLRVWHFDGFWEFGILIFWHCNTLLIYIFFLIQRTRCITLINKTTFFEAWWAWKYWRNWEKCFNVGRCNSWFGYNWTWYI